MLAARTNEATELRLAVADKDKQVEALNSAMTSQKEATDVAIQSLKLQRKEATKKTLGLIVISVAAGIIVGHL